MSAETVASAFPAPPVAPAVDPPVATKPWGPWSTLAWGIAIYLGSKPFGVIAFFIASPVSNESFPGPLSLASESEIAQFERFMSFLGLASLGVTAPVGILLTFVAARWGRGLPPLREYLGLSLPTRRQALLWTLGFAVLQLTLTVALRSVDSPSSVEQLEAYRTAWSLPTYWLVVVIVGPLFEEVFYRGFLLPGLAASRLRPIGALLVTTALFTLMHAHYDRFFLAAVFAAGLFYGAARLATGSVWLSCWFHMLHNAYVIYMMELALLGG